MGLTEGLTLALAHREAVPDVDPLLELLGEEEALPQSEGLDVLDKKAENVF